MRHTSIALACSILLAGCGGSPRIDASSDSALDASVKRVTAGLSDDQKKVFAADCMTISMPAIMKAAFGSAFKKDKAAPPNKLDIFRPLDGMTADEVHAKAQKLRQDKKADAEKKALTGK